MDEQTLAKPFADQRTHLQSVAYRMLGSTAEAEDALQEAWLRISRAGATGVENLGGWMTTVTARVCLDMLRARKSRREDDLDSPAMKIEPVADKESAAGDPSHNLALADSIGLALLVVLETLDPVERVAFVLHDMFDLPFEEIAKIVGKSPAATRQLASRARRRVRGEPAHANEADVSKQRAVVDAFLTAARGGDLGALVSVLAPEVVLTADKNAVQATKANPNAPQLAEYMRGRDAVAATFAGRARAARPALIDGITVGAAWAPNGEVRSVFLFTLDPATGAIASIDLMSEPSELATLDVKFLDT
jgi:RNA polymerase sigma factor (sigma-70 family)